MSDLVGRRLGPYELFEVVRTRRTSTTYRAVGDARPVVVTVLARVDDTARAAALLEEARAVARLRHPHIVPLEDVGEQDGHVYLVEDLASWGHTLADLVGDAFEPARAVGLVAPLLMALSHAHEHGVVHGDITPRHIALPSPVWPMLTDFAIGRSLPGGPPAQGRAPGQARPMVVGTPAYIAPEQAFGMAPESRADVYSAAVVLYQLLGGRVPFDGDTPQSILRQQVYDPPPPLRTIRPDVPAVLERVVRRALSKPPDDRPSAQEFADELLAACGKDADTDAVDLPAGREPAGGEPSATDPLGPDYATGVRAFASRQWDAAIVALDRVAQTDPSYEDVEALLEVARSAVDRPGQA